MRNEQALKYEAIVQKYYPRIVKKIVKNAEDGIFQTKLFFKDGRDGELPYEALSSWIKGGDPYGIDIVIDTLKEMIGEGFEFEKSRSALTITLSTK
jgi:hypothetical protein